MTMYEVENPLVRPLEESTVKRVAICCECSESLYSNEEFLALEGEYFCDLYCLKDYLGVQTIEGWEIE